MAEDWSRKDFLKFMGRAGVALGGLSVLDNCSPPALPPTGGLPFTPLTPRSTDDLILADGLSAQLLIREGEPVNTSGARFGKNNDYITFLPDTAYNRSKSTGGDSGLLWVNHEMPIPLEVLDTDELLFQPRSRQEALQMQSYVGGSLLAVSRSGNEWTVNTADPRNRRFDGRTEMPMVSSEPVPGGQTAVGTLGNCAGGRTPWGTILVCEENHRDYYGERNFKTGKVEIRKNRNFGWHKFFDYPPEHYGWVVEVDPRTGTARKHTALGRYFHECATVREAGDGRVAVYSGDDTVDGCIYKFISKKAGSIDEGVLYTANIDAGRWEPLTTENPRLKSYRSQMDILLQARQAARDAGGTLMDRPEDIEIDPLTGAAFISLTNNKKRLNFYGSILKIVERDNDPLSLEFQADTFLSGGSSNGFACPDNLAFDPRGNLWMASDISQAAANRYPYHGFGNNGLFFIPLEGARAGNVYQVGSAPTDAEMTGLCFAPDGRSLFVSVQHPGMESRSKKRLTSHWPDGGDSMPRSAVAVLTGPVLDQLSAI